MTTTGPTARQVRWAVVLLAVIAGLYLYLHSINLHNRLVAAGAILLVVGVLLCDLLAFAANSRHRPRRITLPWWLLRRAIDVAIIATVAVGFAVSTSGDASRGSDSYGTLSFDGNQQTEVTGTVDLPVGRTALWYAVHCDDCGELDSRRTDHVRFPGQLQVAVSGPSTVTVQRISHSQEAVSKDSLGPREQKPFDRLDVAKAGAYTVQVRVKPYSLPFHRVYYPRRQILLGPYEPGTPLVDRTRLLILAVLLALSVLVMLRPRRVSSPGPVPAAQPA